MLYLEDENSMAIKNCFFQAISLTQQCQSKSLKLQQYKRRIEETYLLARDEAAKCNAAKNVIQILRTQVCMTNFR